MRRVMDNCSMFMQKSGGGGRAFMQTSIYCDNI